MRYTTADGSTVILRPISCRLMDVQTVNPAGDTISTVRMPRAEAMILVRAAQNTGRIAR